MVAMVICIYQCAIACNILLPVAKSVPIYTYKILNTYPHDPEAWVEGLAFENGRLYEGTGLYGHSSVRKVALETGKILQILRLPETYYGEGITLFGDNIVELTLESQKGFVYDKKTFEVLHEFAYESEGWGLTHDETSLIMSDGSSTLRLLDPVTLEPTGHIEVRDSGTPVKMINELEYVNGKIYANIWKTNRIAIIDRENGEVSGWVDLTGLLDRQKYGDTPDVLNGIAYDESGGRLFVTGKLWPLLFEIELVPTQYAK
jgi:glutamine cyclotransferase